MVGHWLEDQVLSNIVGMIPPFSCNARQACHIQTLVGVQIWLASFAH